MLFGCVVVEAYDGLAAKKEARGEEMVVMVPWQDHGFGKAFLRGLLEALNFLCDGGEKSMGSENVAFKPARYCLRCCGTSYHSFFVCLERLWRRTTTRSNFSQSS